MTAALTGYTVNTIEDLKNIPESIRTSGYIKAVKETHQFYQFEPTSTDIADGINIIAPNLGSGRWYIMSTDIEPILKIGQQLYLINLPYTVYQSSQFSNGSYTAPLGTYNLFNDNSTITGTCTETNLTEEYIIADLGEPRYVTQHIFGGGRIQHNSLDVINVADYLNDCTLYGSSDAINWDVIADINNISNNNSIYTRFNIPLSPYRYWKLVRTSGLSKYVAVSEWKIKGISVSNEDDNEIVIKASNLNSLNNVIIPVTVPNTFNVVNISFNYPARIRVYLTENLANADLNRLENTTVTSNLGCLLDVFSVDNLDLNKKIIPSIYSYSINANKLLYFTVTNKDIVTRDMVITLSIKTNKNYDLNYINTTNILYNMMFI